MRSGARSRKTGTVFAAAREAPGDMLVFRRAEGNRTLS